jgi:small GTP-binding protein
MDDDNAIGIKVTLIGDSSVGKTCIINKYCKGLFDSEVDSTLGANYSQKKLEKNGKKIRLDLWDTAGQEKYRAIGRHFYKESYIVCLVYDITNKQSFESLKTIWYPELKEYGEKYKIIALIGNKIDRYLEETVSEEEGKKFAEEINAVFKRTSALSDSDTGISDLFDELVDKYLNDQNKGENNNNKDENIKIKKEVPSAKPKEKRC